APRRSLRSKKKWLFCWACRRPTRNPDGRRGGSAARLWPDRSRLRGVGTVARHLHRRQAVAKLPPAPVLQRPKPARALAPHERQGVIDILREPQYVDQAPAEIYASLLDQGVYYCSIRTMYRILGEHDEIKERRRQLRHPVYQKPELLAEGPNQVWSWDISAPCGEEKWTYFYLYVIIDIFSR